MVAGYLDYPSIRGVRPPERLVALWGNIWLGGSMLFINPLSCSLDLVRHGATPGFQEDFEGRT